MTCRCGNKRYSTSTPAVLQPCVEENKDFVRGNDHSQIAISDCQTATRCIHSSHTISYGGIMKKIALVLLPLILAACNGNVGNIKVPTGSKTDVALTLDPINITYAHVYQNENKKRDGQFENSTITIKDTSTFKITVKQGSLGAHFTEAKLRVLDKNGNPVFFRDATNIEDERTIYLSAVVKPGFVCASSEGAIQKVEPHLCPPGMLRGHENVSEVEASLISLPLAEAIVKNLLPTDKKTPITPRDLKLEMVLSGTDTQGNKVKIIGTAPINVKETFTEKEKPKEAP